MNEIIAFDDHLYIPEKKQVVSTDCWPGIKEMFFVKPEKSCVKCNGTGMRAQDNGWSLCDCTNPFRVTIYPPDDQKQIESQERFELRKNIFTIR